MMLNEIIQQKPDIFDRLNSHWQHLTGGQLLVIDEEGEWVTGGPSSTQEGNGVLPENWREWLAASKQSLDASKQSLDASKQLLDASKHPLDASKQPIDFNGKPVQIAPLDVQEPPASYLVAVGEASPDLFCWATETLKDLVSTEQSLQGMTGELISAWDQLGLVYDVTQSLASTSDLITVLRSVLTAVKRVLKAEEGFLILEQENNLTHVSVGTDDPFSPQRRQLYHRLYRAERLVLYNDLESLREFWADAPASLVNLLGMRLPVTAPARAVIALTNKGERIFTAGDGKMLTAVAEQIAAIINNNLLHQKVLAQERMQRELEIAAEIQMSLLPHGLPEIPDVEFSVASLPATEVGGDFYDFIPLDDDCLGIVVGDVAGKGVPAAMLTSLARTILRVEAGYGHSPQRVINQTNQALIQDLERAEMFVTAQVACLNRNDLTLTYANAGHTPSLWWRADRATFELLPATTPPLGIKSNEVGENQTIQLSPGDFVLFYSDGVTEAMSPDSEIFGGDRLQEALIAHAGSTAQDLVQSVLSAVRAFRKSAPWSDDLTMIAMRIRQSVVPQVPEPEPSVEFVHPADLQVLDTISEQVTRACRALTDLPPSSARDDFVYLVELAVSEICTNIIQHAYPVASGQIRGSLTPLVNGIQIDLYDDGVSFDPTTVPTPTTQVNNLNEGGYGLHIVRQIMDRVLYQANTPKGNHWRLIKYIAQD